MDYLPKDPAILVSSVNMLLRDKEFDTLESLCYNFGTEPKEMKNYLYEHGFVYSEKQKQFRWQKDDIELAISDYANDMSQELYDAISGGRADFLRDHKRFKEDITKAVEILEKML